MKLRNAEMDILPPAGGEKESRQTTGEAAAATTTTTTAEKTAESALPFADEVILEGIPQRNVKAARLLLSYVKRNPDLAWTKNGEMIVNGDRMPNTNIVDLIHDFSRYRKSVPPPLGYLDFGYALKRQNIPREGVANQERWRTMQHPSIDFMHSPVYVRTPATVRKTPTLSDYETPAAASGSSSSGGSTPRATATIPKGRKLPFAWVENK